MRRYGVFILVLLLALLAVTGFAEEECECLGEHDWVEVNGQRLHYAVAGEGKPVVILHGNGDSHEDMKLVMEQLVSVDYRVYALDSRGQGANEPLDEYHYSDMAEDTYQFIQEMGLEKPAVYGYSDGGIIALEMVLAHPDCVSLLAVSGVNLNPEGAPEYIVIGSQEGASPLEKMMMTEPQIDPEALKGVTMPVMITAGEWDFVLEEHTRMIAEKLPNAELYMMEGESHDSYVIKSYSMGDMLARFLQEQEY